MVTNAFNKETVGSNPAHIVLASECSVRVSHANLGDS